MRSRYTCLEEAEHRVVGEELALDAGQDDGEHKAVHVVDDVGHHQHQDRHPLSTGYRRTS